MRQLDCIAAAPANDNPRSLGQPDFFGIDLCGADHCAAALIDLRTGKVIKVKQIDGEKDLAEFVKEAIG